MINCIIIDDEPLAAQLLSSYADKVEDIQLLGVFHNPLSALTFLKDQKVDLVFLDIQMPELSGTQLAKICLLYTSPSPRDQRGSRMPSSA